jgi:2-polyprenyl-3-methyl-5-hydroxy-6-metoxy-1,4-benzoquinol methylase
MDTSIQPEKPVGATEPEHLDLVARYFDESADEWSSLYEKATRANDLLLADRKKLAVKFVESHLEGGARILDAGCGAGLTALELARRGYVLHGVDVSEKMIALAREHFRREGIPSERYEFGEDDLSKGTLPEGSFDGVTALGFLQYQSDEASALAAINRLLEPGGILVISGPMGGRKICNYLGLANLYYRSRGLARRLLRRPPRSPSSPFLLQQISVHSYTVRRFKQLLGDAGFDVLISKGHGFVGYEIIDRWLSPRAEVALHRFFTGLAKVLPIGRWGNDLIVVARKR